MVMLTRGGAEGNESMNEILDTNNLENISSSFLFLRTTISPGEGHVMLSINTLFADTTTGGRWTSEGLLPLALCVCFFNSRHDVA